MPTFPSGRMLVALACHGGVRLLVVSLPGPAGELASRHGLGPAARLRAGEGLVAAALLSAHVKGEERLTFDLRCTAPECAGTFEVNGDGRVRGRFRPEGVPDGAALTGMLSVAKSLGRRELYRGVAEVQGETVEGALQRFLRESQQVDARVRVAVALDADGAIEYADGLLVERLPDHDPGAFAALVAELDGDLLRVLDELQVGRFGGGPIDLLGEAELRFDCGCSRAKVEAMIRSLGADEITAMIVEQGGAEVTCHYCNEVNRFGVAELEALRDEARAVGEA